MGNAPVIHEVGTSCVSLGDAITGHPEKARERWKTYAQESFVGSCVAGIAEEYKGNRDKANDYWKGMGRATGKLALGGGLLRDVPGFHELAVCGESLGDVIGGGDTKSAEKRWKTYVEGSLIGGGIAALGATIEGNDEEAKKFAKGCGKAALKFVVTAAGMAATAATGGLAAPYGVAFSAATGATVGGATGAASTALVQVIDKGKVDDAGAVVGSGLFGGVVGGVSEGIAAKRAAAKRVAPKAKAQANRPKRATVDSESLSTSSEAEFFPQQSSKAEQSNSFSFEGGKAKRNNEFSDVWSPKDAGKKADLKAANEAARIDIQESLKNCSRKARPAKTSVIQDAKGNAYGTSSVRGPNRAKLQDTLGSKQSRVLDSIPEEDRSVGHGNCAEQVAVNNTRYFRQKTGNQLFPKNSTIKVQAYAQMKGVKGVYNVPVKPCTSCQVVLNEVGISHSATQAVPLKCDVMAYMIAAGLIVGCKACQHCQEKKN